MEPIKKFFECLIPVTACNLKCSYCYVIQRNNRKNKLPEMKYSIQTIKKSLSKKYSWGDSISKKKIQKDVVKLPVISNSNKIDFDYMEKYITAIQKLVIRDVVDYKDKLISETKSVIEK